MAAVYTMPSMAWPRVRGESVSILWPMKRVYPPCTRGNVLRSLVSFRVPGSVSGVRLPDGFLSKKVKLLA